jgi:hypothetical protein
VLVLRLVLPEVMRMHDARSFTLNHELESIAPKDEYKQYNRLLGSEFGGVNTWKSRSDLGYFPHK